MRYPAAGNRPRSSLQPAFPAAVRSTDGSSSRVKLKEVGQTDASCGGRQLAEVRTTSARKPMGDRCIGRPHRCTVPDPENLLLWHGPTCKPKRCGTIPLIVFLARRLGLWSASPIRRSPKRTCAACDRSFARGQLACFRLHAQDDNTCVICAAGVAHSGVSVLSHEHKLPRWPR